MAALGVPLVVLHGSQPARTWLPRSWSGSPVAAVGGPPWLERADEIPVEAVLDAWLGLGASASQAAAHADLELPPAPLSSQTTSVRIDPSALSSRVR